MRSRGKSQMLGIQKTHWDVHAEIWGGLKQLTFTVGCEESAPRPESYLCKCFRSWGTLVQLGILVVSTGIEVGREYVATKERFLQVLWALEQCGQLGGLVVRARIEVKLWNEPRNPWRLRSNTTYNERDSKIILITRCQCKDTNAILH